MIPWLLLVACAAQQDRSEAPRFRCGPPLVLSSGHAGERSAWIEDALVALDGRVHVLLRELAGGSWRHPSLRFGEVDPRAAGWAVATEVFSYGQLPVRPATREAPTCWQRTRGRRASTSRASPTSWVRRASCAGTTDRSCGRPS